MSPLVWLPILAIAFVLGAVFDLDWLVIITSSVLFWIGIAYFWNRFSIKGLVYRRRWHYRRGFPGEIIPVKLIVENRKFLPLTWLRITEPWPRAVAPQEITESDHPAVAQNEVVHLFSFKPGQQIKRSMDLNLQDRGIYPVGPSEVDTGDPFGFFETRSRLSNTEYLTVFPRLVSFSSLGVRTDDPFGDLAARRRLFEDPNRPMGARPYHPEDDIRRIHWPATARTGSLQVKVYQPVSAQVMMVCLNVQTSAQPWLGMRSDLLEKLISITATVVYQGIQDGYSVGLLSNGCLTHSDHPFQISPGRSPDQLSALLQSLAGVTPYMTSPFEPYLLKSLSGIPYGATLVLITGFFSPTLPETLTRLKKYRSRMTLISLAEDSPGQIPGIQMIHLPFCEPEKVISA